MTVRNTLAYYDTESIAPIKKFYIRVLENFNKEIFDVNITLIQ